jgi:hypothetical protein
MHDCCAQVKTSDGKDKEYMHGKQSRLGIIKIGFLAAALVLPSAVRATPECDEHSTGGGWIITSSGRKANFGFNAFWDSSTQAYKGHINYVDRNAGLHVSSGTAFDYAVIGPTTRGFRWTSGGPRYDEIRLFISDNGEPGITDWFEIQLLLNGNIVYREGGTLGASGHGGGNIQIHKQNCR